MTLYQKLEDEVNGYMLIKDLGLIAYIQGEYKIAKSYYEESLEWFRLHSIKDGIGSALRWLGDLERISGSYKQAAVDYREALQYNSEVDLPLAVAATLSRLGQIALHEEKADKAQSLFLDSLKMQNEGGNRYGIVECLTGLAGVAVLKKEPKHAARLFGAAQALLELMVCRFSLQNDLIGNGMGKVCALNFLKKYWSLPGKRERQSLWRNYLMNW